MSIKEAMDLRDEGMRSTAEGFCEAFVAGMASSKMLDTYFTSNPKITEHGPSWAKTRLPFLGSTFSGRRRRDAGAANDANTCDDYYDLLNATLSFHPHAHTVPAKEEFLIASGTTNDGRWWGAVTIKLNAGFASVRTSKSWEEDFVYVLSEFDENLRIGHLELWADPLSAWLAVGGN